MSSACGSADVLEKLGIVIELTPEQNKECVENCGICFMYAPINHPAMKSVAPVRKALGKFMLVIVQNVLLLLLLLGVRTAFNLLGPITNAASANRVVIGVYEEYLVDLIGKSLIEIGQIEHGVVIHGCGLDEISPLGPSQIFEIKNISPDGAPKKYKTKK